MCPEVKTVSRKEGGGQADDARAVSLSVSIEPPEGSDLLRLTSIVQPAFTTRTLAEAGLATRMAEACASAETQGNSQLR